jgi:outer membrane lipopolysaccharide assembly protein LptE/RlpB
MIRLFLLAATAGLLAGCATHVQQSTVIPGPPAEEAVSPDDAHCQSVARQRASDALVNGYGLQIQESVFREAYRDCMTWRSGRPG